MRSARLAQRRQRPARRTWSPTPARRERSYRGVALTLLWLGPVVIIAGAFLFGVLIQALGLVGAAKQGGLLSALGGGALTILIAALLCVPGYIIAVVWFGWQTRSEDDVAQIKSRLWAIPFFSLLMCWIPAVVIPKLTLALRLQAAGFTVLLILLFGYLWILVVRLLLALAVNTRVVDVGTR